MKTESVDIKKEKSFAELLGLTALSTMIVGLVILILSMLVNILSFEGNDPTLDFIEVIAALVFMTPFFLLQFVMPSGLLSRFESQVDITFWGNLMFYLMIFPFADVWMVAAADSLFHFLPDYHAAMAQGFDRNIVIIMHHDATNESWTIVGIIYVSLISLGLIVRGVSAKIKFA